MTSVRHALAFAGLLYGTAARAEDPVPTGPNPDGMPPVTSAPAASPPAPAPEPAKPADAKPSVKISGVVYAHYGLDLTDGAEKMNSFDLDRAYVKADAKLTDKIATRVTIDANRLAPSTVTLPDGSTAAVPTDTRLRVFVKHAWVDFTVAKDIHVLGGVIETPYVSFFENQTGMRWTARVFLEEDRLESSADLGVVATGKHKNGLVSWAAGVYNGEYYTNPEVSAGKSVQGRLTVDPLAKEGAKIGLPITIFVDENVHDGGSSTLTSAGNVGFTNKVLNAYVEAIASSVDGVTGLGESVQVVPKIPDVVFFYARYDHWDPTVKGATDGTSKVWLGAAHEFLPKVDLGVSYERTMAESTPETPSHGIFVRMQAGY
jgi:hypothetical protein